jgi:dynein heavy chain
VERGGGEGEIHQHRLTFDAPVLYTVRSSPVFFFPPVFFQLRTLLAADLLRVKDDIEDICDSADKQMAIDTKLSEVRGKWSSAAFTFEQYKGKGKVYLLKGYGQIIEDLEESQLALQTMLSMRHVGPFRESSNNMLSQLSDTADTLELWIKVQLLWQSLESVFTGGDIMKQMPLEAKKFSKIDKDWTKCMVKAEETLIVTTCCSNELLKNSLPIMYTELEKCQKSLEGYLEQKRNKFPRFYFVSNSVLLQILSRGSDYNEVQQYYEKLFDSVRRAVHSSPVKGQSSSIVGLQGISGSDVEDIVLLKPVQVQGNIETWLLKLQVQMQETMKDTCERAADDCSEMELREFVDRYPGQFALLGLQFNWTQHCTDALDRELLLFLYCCSCCSFCYSCYSCSFCSSWHGFALVLHWFCIGFALVLHWFCIGFA